MSRFREELRVIPGATRILGVTLSIILAAILTLLMLYGNDDPGIRTFPVAGKIAVPILAPLVLLILVSLIGYVYGDAKRRGMRYVMWTWLAALVPDGMGIIMYFILRDAMPSPCARCGTQVPAKFAFCPHCGTPLKPTCPQCGKAVEPGWINCAYCGTKLPSPPQHTA
jgi:Double zinc ribbon